MYRAANYLVCFSIFYIVIYFHYFLLFIYLFIYLFMFAMVYFKCLQRVYIDFKCYIFLYVYIGF